MTEIDAALDRCARLAAAAIGDARPKRAADAAFYLAHIEASAPLRRLADLSGKSVSSVHRAVRRIEILRDDPLIDRALDALGEAARALATDAKEIAVTPTPDAHASLSRSARRALEALAEADAFLMVANGAERAGVFSRRNRCRRPVTLLPVAEAADLAARDFLRCASRSEASAKYAITPVGRAWLKREAAVRAGEAAPFSAQHAEPGERSVAAAGGAVETLRVNLGESPLGWLARRRGADGSPFLAAEEVEAGERLRADFEAAQMGPRVTQDWRSFLAPRDTSRGPSGPAEGPRAARERVVRAVEALGPGLSDAAIRACCFLEGLEATERRMGWSARSGKVVLKIALQRLALHYGLAGTAAAA
mgnify:CR=1 FL=1